MTTTASPDLTALRTGLRQWFADVAELELAAVQWEDEPRQMIPGLAGLLNVVAERALGQDERQWEYDAGADPGEEIVRKVGGPRVLTLSLKLDGYDQRLNAGPFFRMSAIAAKLRGEDACSALRALGFALIDAVGPTNIGREDHGRVYPRAVLDVFLGYTRVEGEAPTTWVETVKGLAEFRDADGVLLPTPPNGEITIPEAP
jgi:hypothetical protein